MVLPEVLDFCREEAQARLAELAVLVGVGSEGEDPSQLSCRFIQAVRDLRTEVGIASSSQKIQQQDFDELCSAAIAEGSMYPVPKLLDAAHTMEILHKLLP
jgi:alcohol dehydrogenase class IV